SVFGLKRVDNIRVYGLLFQLIGTSVIVYSFKEKLFLFKGYGVLTFLLDYLRGFPWTKKSISHTLNANAGIFTSAAGRMNLIKKPKENFQDIIRYFDERVEDLQRD